MPGCSRAAGSTPPTSGCPGCCTRAVLRSPHAHARLGDDPRQGRARPARRRRRRHRRGPRRRRPHPDAARSPRRHRRLPAAAARARQGPLRRRARGVRRGREPLPGRGRARPDRGRLRSVAGGRRCPARPGSPARLFFTRRSRGTWSTRSRSQKGDAARALASAPYRVRERFSVQRHTGVPIETRGLTAAHDPGTGVLRLWGVAKVPHFNRRVLADLLGYPEHLIQFVELEVGGGFGVRGEFYPEDLLIPWLAMRLGRPVQWIEDRREHLMATNHSRQQYHDIEIGFDRDGRIVALADRFVVDMGAYIRTHGVVVPELTAALLPGPYRIPNYSCHIRVRAHEQDPDRHVSRPRSVRMHVRPRAPDGHRGPAAGARSPRAATTELHHTRRDAVRGRRRLARPAHRLRLRRLSIRTGPGARGHRLRGGPRRAGGRRAGRDATWASASPAWWRRPGWDHGSTRGSRSMRPATSSSTPASPRSGRESRPRWPRSAPMSWQWRRRPSPWSTATALGSPSAWAASPAAGPRLRCPPRWRLPARSGRRSSEWPPGSWRRLRRDLVVEAGAVHVRGAPDRRVSFRELARAALPGPPDLEPGLQASHMFEAPKMTYPYGTHVAMVEVDPETGQVKTPQVRDRL